MLRLVICWKETPFSHFKWVHLPWQTLFFLVFLCCRSQWLRWALTEFQGYILFYGNRPLGLTLVNFLHICALEYIIWTRCVCSCVEEDAVAARSLLSFVEGALISCKSWLLVWMVCMYRTDMEHCISPNVWVCGVRALCGSLLLCLLKAISKSQECKCEYARVQPAIYTVMSRVSIPMYKAHVVQGWSRSSLQHRQLKMTCSSVEKRSNINCFIHFNDSTTVIIHSNIHLLVHLIISP